MLKTKKSFLILAMFFIAVFGFTGLVYGEESTAQTPKNFNVSIGTNSTQPSPFMVVTAGYGDNSKTAYFKVYRKTGENDSWETAYKTLSETPSISLSDYKANNVGATYYYYVTAIKNGQESEPTEIKSLTLSWPNCSDTDADSEHKLGINYYTKGTHKDKTDYCVDDSKLHELFCSAGDQTFNLNYTCPNGYRDGACINSTSSTKKPYMLKGGVLSSSGNSYDGAHPNYDKGYTYIVFMASSKNPTFPSGIFQSTPSGSPYFKNSNDYGNEALKIAWTNTGGGYGEGDLTLEGNATVTVNFDNNPITIYLPKIPLCTEATHPDIDLENPECWRRTDRKSPFGGSGTCPDEWNFDGICANYEGAHYLYAASDGSTYWDSNLTKLARAAGVNEEKKCIAEGKSLGDVGSATKNECCNGLIPYLPKNWIGVLSLKNVGSTKGLCVKPGQECSYATCKSGYSCSDGECVKEKKCADSDGGKNIYTKGVVKEYFTSDQSTTKYDSCQSKQIGTSDSYEEVDSCSGDSCYVFEYWPAGEICHGETMPCLNGCRDGACIDDSIKKINNSANLLHENKLDEILSELKELRDIVREQAAEIKYLKNLKEDVQNLSDKVESAINNFITYL